MSDRLPLVLCEYAAITWVGALAIIILWKLLTGAIDLSELLQGDQAAGQSYFSPGRAQLLAFTVLFALQLLMQVMARPTEFPVIPHEFLLVLGGSQTVYLVGKARAMLR